MFWGFADEVRRFAKKQIADLVPSPNPVWVAGIVVSLRTQMTRRGKMSVMVLDDASGAVEVSIFNEVFERHRAIIREDELLVLQVKVSKDDYSGGQRVVAERVLDLVVARQEFGKRLRIRSERNCRRHQAEECAGASCCGCAARRFEWFFAR